MSHFESNISSRECCGEEDGTTKKKRRRAQNDIEPSHSLSEGSISNANNNNHHSNTESTQEEGVSLSYLVLSKSWQAAALRAISHPQEAQFGCTSLARLPVPLDSHSVQHSHNSNHHTQNTAMMSSPLAIACRYRAPPNTVRAILNANPYMVRRCIPNRGTPLHEAIMNFYGASSTTSSTHTSSSLLSSSRNSPIYEHHHSYNSDISFDMQSYEQVISMLIEADEQIYKQEVLQVRTTNLINTESNHKNYVSQRATMMQDVDGNNPLHLFVRHAFYNYVGNISSSSMQGASSRNGNLMAVFQQLIQSSPEASSAPDLSQYEETPLILVLKSSLYAQEQYQSRRRYDENQDDDDIFNFNAQLEQGIFQACKMMLKENPSAASVVASKSGYTPVHSAVYHGRCCDTIRLLLQADCKYLNSISKGKKQPRPKTHVYTDPLNNNIAATMRTNRFGETPLHFAAMRGECTKTIKLLSQAAPWAALKRDEKYGLTPLHWLLVRFVVRMSEQFNMDQVDLEDDQEVAHSLDETGSTVRSKGPQERQEEQYEGKRKIGEDQVLSNETIPSALHDPTSSSIPDDDEQIQFDLEYHRRTCAIDPPCEYIRMRHILPEQEHAKVENYLVHRIVKVLSHVRETHFSLMQRMKQISDHYHKNGQDDKIKKCPFSENHSLIKSQRPAKVHETVVFESNFKASSVSCPHSRTFSGKQVKGVCPFSKSNQTSKSDLQLEDSRNDATFSKTGSCPFAHSIPGKQSLRKVQLAQDADTKKCPFRCPFVFESYPIDSSMMGMEGEALREEKVISLFWAKVNSLLHAAAVANMVDFDTNAACFPLLPTDTNINMLHTACSSSTPLAVIRLCVALYPEQLMLQDCDGKYPLHHAASRIWDFREFRILSTVPTVEDSDINEGVAPNLIAYESKRSLELILESSPIEASKARDSEGRIAFHHAIDSVVTAMMKCTKTLSSSTVVVDDESIFSVNSVLRTMMQMYPEVIEQKDGKSGLYPFMQASAKASEVLSSLNTFSEECSHSVQGYNNLSLSICYELLLASPSLVIRDV